MTTRPATIDLLKEQCNRYVNGECRTRRCLLRGIWKAGDSADKATCEYHEAVLAIQERNELMEALRPFAEAHRFLEKIASGFLREQFVASMTASGKFTEQDLARAAALVCAGSEEEEG